MIEEIEPNPHLIKYFEITHNFKTNLSLSDFTNNGEHFNVLSNIDQNIFLLKRLEERGLLKDSNSICDCGIGLGNCLFEIYLQSKEIDKNENENSIKIKNENNKSNNSSNSNSLKKKDFEFDIGGDDLNDPSVKLKPIELWGLRAKAVNEKISLQELGRVLYWFPVQAVVFTGLQYRQPRLKLEWSINNNSDSDKFGQLWYSSVINTYGNNTFYSNS